MRIIINYIAAGGRIYDLIYTISAHYNFGSVGVLHKMNSRNADDQIDTIFADLNEKLKNSPDGIDVFFQYYEGRPCCMTMLFMKIMWDFETPAEFIRYYSKMDIHELYLQVLAYYDNYRLENNQYKVILSDSGTFSAFIGSLHLLNDFKSKLLLFFENPNSCIENIVRVMTYVLNKMRAVLHLKKAETDEFVKRTFSVLKNDTCLLSIDKDPFIVDLTQYSIINFTVSVINDAVVYIVQGEDQFNLCFGLYHEKYIQKSLEYTEQMDIQAIAKALGEDLRYRIFNMLKKKDMYMTEVAAALDLPPAAICYHINLLLKSRLITTTTQGRKTYYSINRKQIDAIAKFIKVSFTDDKTDE
jgi:DNA-binding transcriptional ArsR family regulator